MGKRTNHPEYKAMLRPRDGKYWMCGLMGVHPRTGQAEYIPIRGPFNTSTEAARMIAHQRAADRSALAELQQWDAHQDR